MQTEKQRERLVELLKETFEYTRGTCIDFDEAAEINADYLMSNNVVVLPENAIPEISAKIVSEDKEKAIVEEKYVITWKNKRTLLKAKENVK